jgi:hypothetical protein
MIVVYSCQGTVPDGLSHLTLFENKFRRINTMDGQAQQQIDNTERVFVIIMLQIADENGSLAKRSGRIAAEMCREKYTGEEPDSCGSGRREMHDSCGPYDRLKVQAVQTNECL